MPRRNGRNKLLQEKENYITYFKIRDNFIPNSIFINLKGGSRFRKSRRDNKWLSTGNDSTTRQKD